MSDAINFCGGETGDLTEFESTSGNIAISSAQKRTGVSSYLVNPVATAVGYGRLMAIDATGRPVAMNEDSLGFRLAIRPVTLPGSADEEIFLVEDTAASTILTVRLRSDGKLSIYKNGTTLLQTGATVLSVGTWYVLALSIRKFSANHWGWSLYVNAANELSAPDDDLGTVNMGACRFGKGVDRNGQTISYYLDDLLIGRAYVPVDGAVLFFAPDSTGNYDVWFANGAATNWQCNDEEPNNVDTDYSGDNSVGSVGDAFTAGLVSCATAGLAGSDVINSAKSFAFVRKSGGATPSATKVRLRSASTDDDTSNYVLTTSYLVTAKIYNTDPATGSAWTQGGINAAEVGAVMAVAPNPGQTVRSTACGLMVDFSPAGPPPPADQLFAATQPPLQIALRRPMPIVTY